MREQFTVDLRGLVEDHPSVELDDGEARCDGARAWRDGARIDSEGPAERALRASCALAWNERQR